jgi:hypothetical protein
MSHYKFRISGDNTTIDIVNTIINKDIGDHYVGTISNYKTATELGQQIVYGELETRMGLEDVRRNFKKAFDAHKYSSSVDNLI